ncbi:hypothetical protein PF010_g32967 [Phytophthora fragariae]|uniref:Malic enzyme n=1 Tax=Phytophthora fragariae TaxID=53985 RepID=A0A6A4BU72_9STRA|nr:hypothetical protein PF003_g37253 [Phytophthora fragariae]KAE8945847.1 hypothetical protein PF009_g4498 [Phytophthora fragariae]KAE8950998.1 hypothetical protein PF011_g33078 [Phytophthora fragariae]KAE9053288.1 hypothetical protein PF010_g32967 [Phytophthora fragariae]KAE9249843.1 hypothetical protein PF002_g5077 [Phytophthora fragariae]
MGIPVGKLTLYTACTGVPLQMRLPVVLDCGTNNLADPFYISRLQKRFEKFGKSTTFHLLRNQNTHCPFNDDVQGTAPVMLGGLLASVPLPGKPISERKFGAGTVGTDIVDLIAQAISRETGKTVEESRKQI